MSLRREESTTIHDPWPKLRYIGNMVNKSRPLIEKAIRQSELDIKIDNIAYQYGQVLPGYFSLYTNEHPYTDHAIFWGLFTQLERKQNEQNSRRVEN